MRRIRVFVIAAALSLLVGAVPSAVGMSITETVAATTAENVPDPSTGWLPVDYVPHALPVHTPGERPGEAQFPTILRVDNLPLTERVYDARFYLWSWTHGMSPRTLENGGRMRLATADSLEGPWTDRGWLTPKEGMAPVGWNVASWTAGDVVWSPKHRKFFSTPKSGRGRGAEAQLGSHCDDDSFLMESVDGVNWALSPVQQPILTCGSGYDDMDHGYGRLLRVAGPAGAERWIWMFRGNEARTPEQYITYSIAMADDIYGPWTKAADNPVFDPKMRGVLENGSTLDGAVTDLGQPEAVHLLNLDSFLCHNGWFQIVWQDGTRTSYLSRSKDLRHWETFGRLGADGVTPLGEGAGTPIAVKTGVGANLIYDDTVRTWTLAYHGFWLAPDGTRANSVFISRSASGGTPPLAEPSASCPEIVAPTTLELRAPTEVESTDAFEVSATLTTRGAPVAGATVDFVVGHLAASATTDATGTARLRITADLDPGDHAVSASFRGDRAYWPATTTTGLRVVHEPTVLTYTGATTGRGESVDVAAALTDDDGDPLGGAAVVFTIAGLTTWATTDGGGRAAASVRVPDHGRSQTVDVEYGGSRRRTPSATAGTITWGASASS